MSLIATTWYPSLNPIGLYSLSVLLFLAITAYITHGASGSPANRRRWIVFLLPPLLLAASALTEGSPVFYLWWHARSFPDAQSYAVAYLLLAFGFGFSLQNYRMLDFPFRMNAAVFSGLFGGFIVFEVMLKVFHFPVVYFGGWQVDWSPMFIPLAAFVTIWALSVWYANAYYAERARRRFGCCLACGYDLRGSKGRSTCPECGAIQPDRIMPTSGSG